MKTKTRNFWLAGVSALCLPMASAGPAFGQTTGGGAAPQLEEIVVTAERRETNVQRTAASISVRSGEELAATGRYQLSQILEDVPGIVGGAALNSGSSYGAGSDSPSSGLTIRGIPSNVPAGGSSIGVAPAAALYVDGVYQGVGGSYDLDRVEVLRGPQGTLYGRSATSGLVAIHTADPELSRWGGNAAVELGNYNLHHYTAAVNLPIVDDILAVRIAANRYERDGFYSDEGGFSSADEAKIKVLFKPNDRLSLLVGAAMDEKVQNSGGVSIGLSSPNSYIFTDDAVGDGSNKSHQYWALLTWDLGPATLSYQPAYRSYEESFAVPVTAGAIRLLQSGSISKDDFVTHELRLASNQDSGLTWQVGALHYNNDLASTNELVFTDPDIGLAYRAIVPKKETEAAGLFGEVTVPFADTWRVTLGARYDYTKVQIEQSYTTSSGVTQTIGGKAGERRYHNTTYKVRLEHDLTPQNMLYASVSTGFTPGDVTLTTGATGNPLVLDLESETLTAFELGSKNRFRDNRLQVNAAAYYYDYSGYQVSNINLTPSALYSTYAPINIPLESLGAELEVAYQITDRDRINLNLAYTDSRFTGRSSTFMDTGSGTLQPAGDYIAKDKLPNVVPFTASLGYNHIFEVAGHSTLTLSAAARYLSAHDISIVSPEQLALGAAPYIRVDDEILADLNLIWARDNYSVTGYVRNLGDNQYKNRITINPGAATLSYAVTPYDPRTFGVVLSARF